MAAMASQPSAVVTAFLQAISAGDLEVAMALCHEGLYADLFPTLQPGFENLSGGNKEDIGTWMEEAVALNTQIETEILSEEESEVTARSRISSDYLREVDAAPLIVNEVFKVQDGQVKTWSRTITVNSVNKLQEGLVKLGVPATITPEPGEVLVTTSSDIVGVWTGAIPGGFEGPVTFESNGNYHMEGDSGSFWFDEPFVMIKTEKVHNAGDPRHSCKKGLIGSYVVYATGSGDRPAGLRYVPMLDLCPLRHGFFEGEVHTPR
jgi:limonene-1,2-epoxide hydrolase